MRGPRLVPGGLVLAVAVAAIVAGPAEAVRRTAVGKAEPACSGPASEILATGKVPRRGSVAIGGVTAVVLGRGRGWVRLLVPETLPAGPAELRILDRRGRVRTRAAFQVRGGETCNGADDDCNGAVDDGLAPLQIARVAGTDEPVLLRCRDGSLVREVLPGNPPAGPEPDGNEPCVAGTMEPCWEGPPEARGVGLCHDGARICGEDGTFGRCIDQVLPGEEDPGNGYDEDCNGRDAPGGGELCAVGTIQPCYDGPPRTRGVGACRVGARACNPPGLYGACEDQVLPSPEVEGDGVDQDCDGNDVVVGPQLDLAVDAPFSPTFQPSQVIAGTVDAEIAVPGEPPGQLTASVAPAEGRQGETLEVTITSSDTAFEAGTTSASFGPGVLVLGVSVETVARAVASVRIAPDAALGPRVVAVSAGGAETIATNAFTILPATGAVEGTITDADGTPIEGATVCVSGTAICTTTDADGSFRLDGVETNVTRVLVTKAGLPDLSIPIDPTAGDAIALGALAFERVADPPPPPPEPGAPPLPPLLAGLVARSAAAVTSPHTLMPEQARRIVRDAVLLVGGGELGLLDAGGAQQNPDVAGEGLMSLTPRGQDAIARALVQGDLTTLEDFAFFLQMGFAWAPAPPSIDEVIAVLQAAVDAAWADPQAEESAFAIVLANPGPAFSAQPPVLGRQTTLNRLQAFLLLAGLVLRDHDRPELEASLRHTMLAAALDPGVLSDVPRVRLATHGSGAPPSKRQLSRTFAPMQQYIRALITAEQQINQHFVGVFASGGLRVLEVVSEGIVGVAPNTFRFFRMTADVAPDPPEVVKVEQDGNVVRVHVRRTPHDALDFITGAEGRYAFDYTLYRRSAGRPNRIVVANLKPERAADVVQGAPGLPGVFVVVDPTPDPGLNEYYADVRERVGLRIPESITDRARTSTKVLPDVGSMYMSELLSDFSVPSPFPSELQPAPTDEQVRRSRIFFAPFAAGFAGDRFGELAHVAVDAAGTTHVMDAVHQEIVTIDRRGVRLEYPTGFLPSGLALDRAGNVYTGNAASEGRFGGRMFKYAAPGFARSFVGTVDKYSPLLDRGNPVSVAAVAVGPPTGTAEPNGPLGDLYVGENVRRDVRRVPISIIPAAGIGALPAPGHGIFGAAAASPVVGSTYASVPPCLRGSIQDIVFDDRQWLHVLTQSGLFAVPFRGHSGVAGRPRDGVRFATAIGGDVDDMPASVQIADGAFTVPRWRSRVIGAVATPCRGRFEWTSSPPGVVTLEPLDAAMGIGEVRVTGFEYGTTTVTARYVGPFGSASASVEVTVTRQEILNLLPTATAVPAGSARDLPVKAELHDEAGRPLNGETVLFTVTDLARLVGSAGQQPGLTATAVTKREDASGDGVIDGDGVATVKFRAGPLPGTVTITASRGEVASSQVVKLVESGVRLPPELTELDLVPLPGETPRDTVVRLFKKGITDGPLRSHLPVGDLDIPAPLGAFSFGGINNMMDGFVSAKQAIAGGGNAFSNSVCGNYQARTLQLLNTLRVHPQTQHLFADLEFGPIQAYQTRRDANSSIVGSIPIAHYAVVVYDRNTSHEQTGTVLDPWIQQRPRTYAWDDWNQMFLGTGLPSTSNLAGIYPLTGLDPATPDAFRYPTAGITFLPPAQPNRPLDPEWDWETYRLQVLVDGDVRPIMADDESRQTGIRPDGEIVNDLPYAGFYSLPRGREQELPGRNTHFILMRRAHRLTLTALADGPVDVIVQDADPTRGEVDLYHYPGVVLQAGQVLELDLGPGAMRLPLAVPGGGQVEPETLEWPLDRIAELLEP